MPITASKPTTASFEIGVSSVIRIIGLNHDPIHVSAREIIYNKQHLSQALTLIPKGGLFCRAISAPKAEELAY